MFLKLQSNLVHRRYVRQNSLTNLRNLRRLTSTETLEPVQLAYATYESTNSNQDAQAAPLMIFHGLFGSKSNWNSLCKVYQQKSNPERKIIAVDIRNHGDSSQSKSHTYAHLAADIKNLLDQLNISKAALMGHSMGGRAVMLFTLKYPELVDRLIVVDISPITTSPNLTSMPALFKALESVKLPSNMSMSQARAEVDSQLSKSIAEKSLRSFLLTNLVQGDNEIYNWRVNIPVLLENFNNMARFPLINDLQYDGPVLFLGGSKSDYIHHIKKLVCPITSLSRAKSLQQNYLLWNGDNIDLSYASYELTESYSKSNPQPPVLIVLHDLMGSKNNWNSFCKRYHDNSKHKVIALDLRNHGDSPHTKEHSYDNLVIDLRRFLFKMNIQKVYLLGHSMGGRAVMLFALKYPELVEKLIVADISPITTNRSFNRIPSLLLALKKFELPMNVSLSEARKSVRESLMPVVKNRAILLFLLTNLVQKANGSYSWRFNVDALLENFENISTFPEIHHIVYNGPVLFMGGSKSDYIQKSDYPKILKLFPNAELKFVEGAGHWLHSEKPAEFLKMTLSFLNKK